MLTNLFQLDLSCIFYLGDVKVSSGGVGLGRGLEKATPTTVPPLAPARLGDKGTMSPLQPNVAKVKPQKVITHVVDGFIIKECNYKI